MKITPRCTGLMPNTCASGMMSGTTTTMAEKMSITQPTSSRKMFRASRNSHFDSMCACVQSMSADGTCALTR